jgi:hypothetical protein
MKQYIAVFILVFAAVVIATFVAPPFGKLALSDT